MSDNIQEAEVGSGTKIADTKQSEKRAQITLKAIQLRLKQEKERAALQQQKKSLRVKEDIEESFSPSQIAALKAEYSKINGIDPASDTYKKLIAMLDRLDLKSLQSLAGAEIKFVSKLAQNRVLRKSMKKEDVQLDEISTKLLAKAAHAASDPDADYYYGKSHDPQKFADRAKKTKDAKSAAAVQGAADAKGHYTRPGHTLGSYDKLAHRTPARVTSAGKANKQDVNKLKGNIQRNEATEQDIYVIDADLANGVDQVNIEERMMTKPEKEKKEQMVKSMKKGLAGFKERYGDRAKSVMYATATKNAMKD